MIFITGIAGFLGSHLAETLLAQGHRVVGIDNLIGGDANNVPAKAFWHIGDCNDFSTVKEAMQGAEVVYHCAATAYEGLSVFSPHIVTQNIVTASTGVFSAAAANKVKRIVFCSSMARYGAIRTPYREHNAPRPQDPYGIGKLCAEHILRNLCDTHGIEFVIAVPHNIIGPRQKYDDPYRNVASIFLNLMMQGRSPAIYGDGLQKRCFSYIDDCLSCLVQMGFSHEAEGQVINIGPDENPVTIAELYQIVAGITGYTGKPIYMPGRPQEVYRALCSSDVARLRLGYRTTVDLKDGLRKMRDYILKHGTKPFQYHLPLEIVRDYIPQTWRDRLY